MTNHVDLVNTVEAAILSSLTPDLLSKRYRSEGHQHPLAGHCYIASEAAYYLRYGAHGFKPMVMRWEGGTHWFLYNVLTGERCDLTAGQFTSIPHYPLARGCGFLTNKPSKRGKILIERAKKLLWQTS